MAIFSVIVPVYNEARQLEDFCKSLIATKFPFSVEFIFVDDGSRDRSWEILQQFKDEDNVILCKQPANYGKGRAIRRGIELATGNIIGIQDADFEYNPGDLVKLAGMIYDDKSDVVYGSRFKQQSPRVHRTYHYLGNRCLTFLSNITSGIYLTDMETCYKVFKSEILKGIHLECERFGFEPEITAKIACLDCRIQEYPISYNPRNYAAGKKIGWKDGVAAIWFILRFNILRDLLSLPLFKKELPQRYLMSDKKWL